MKPIVTQWLNVNSLKILGKREGKASKATKGNI